MDKDFTHRFTKADVELTAQVSPCVWMHHHYPLQIRLEMKDGGFAFKQQKGVTWEQTTEAHVVALAESIEVCACSRCGKPAFDPTTVETNRNGLCEKCFLSDLNAEYEAAKKKQEAASKRRDARQKNAGFTHRVTAWIHPAAGDVDSQIDIYWKGEPTKAEIQAQLKKEGSCVRTDYTIVAL